MPLLIHATVEVHGDAALLAAFRNRFNAALAEEFPDTPCTEMHRDDALHYDIKTAAGLPFPALIAVSQEFPELLLAVRWINPEADTRSAADIKAGKIESQSADPLGQSSAGRQPGYVAAHEDGSLYLAFALFSVKNDGCMGYAITADRDALFQIRRHGDRATLHLAEGDAPQWDSCLGVDLVAGTASVSAEDTPLAIDPASYQQWRQYAEAFVAEWFWLDGDAPEATAIERQRCAEHDIPIQPANLRYEKLKLLRERGVSPAKLFDFDSLGETERYVRQILLIGFTGP